MRRDNELKWIEGELDRSLQAPATGAAAQQHPVACSFEFSKEIGNPDIRIEPPNFWSWQLIKNILEHHEEEEKSIYGASVTPLFWRISSQKFPTSLYFFIASQSCQIPRCSFRRRELEIKVRHHLCLPVATKGGQSSTQTRKETVQNSMIRAIL